MNICLLSGAIANKAGNGGAIWTRLSWLLGLRQMGWDAYFVEQIAPAACCGADGAPSSFEDSVNLSAFRHVVAQYGLEGRAALIYDNGCTIAGMGPGELRDVADAAAFILNISGHLTYAPVISRVRHRVYLDLDPGYTQFWQQGNVSGARLERHDQFFTVGANIGTAACAVPTCGLTWRTVRQPVLLHDWPVTAAPGRGFSTVASWRGAYGCVEHGGRRFGQKAHEFRKFMELPRRVNAPFTVALDIHEGDTGDRAALQAAGWTVRDPREVATPGAFGDFVRSSSAEFSVAQGVYVDTNSGWFSDRSVRYLASGKPVLVQDTGFSQHLPVGEGLVAFRTFEDAVAGATAILGSYDRHCRAARRIAEEYFAAERVLAPMLDDIMHGAFSLSTKGRS